MDFLAYIAGALVRALVRGNARGRAHARARARARLERQRLFILRWFPLAWKCALGGYVIYALLGMVGWNRHEDETPCPIPPDVAGAALSPDGTAHLLTRTLESVCWWSVDEDGESSLRRRFHIKSDATVRLTWDDTVGQLRLKSRAPNQPVDQEWLDPIERGAAR